MSETNYFSEIATAATEAFGEAITGSVEDRGDPWIEVAAEKLYEVLQWLRDERRYDQLSLISGVDYLSPAKMEVVYHLDSSKTNQPLTVKCIVSREDTKVPSVVALWKTADWHEREVYDLSGVIFEGHPNLTRILCADDWVGHPLRKDYQWPETYHGIPCGPFALDAVNMPPEWELEGFATRKQK